MEKSIDLSNIPKINNHYNWMESVNKEVKFIYGEYSGVLKIIGYDSIKSYLTLYSDEFTDIDGYSIHTGNVVNCRLKKLLTSKDSGYLYQINEKLSIRNSDLLILDRYKKGKDSLKSYSYRCLTCKTIKHNVSEYSLKSNKGCSVCSKCSVVAGLNDIQITRPDIYNLLKNKKEAIGESDYSLKNVIFLCPDCREEITNAIANVCRSGLSCPKCSDGIKFPNKFMYNILQQLNIDFETEYNLLNTHKRLDFYFKINNQKYGIEMDGHYHKTDKKQIINDKEKDVMCKNSNIKLIRIDCMYKNITNRFEFIKTNILNSKLHYIFDFSSVDFELCNINALKSIVKEICLDYNNKPDLSTLILKYKLSRDTIVKYLVIGTKCNFCTYIPLSNNPIKVHDTKTDSILFFDSMKRLKEHSLDLFGTPVSKRRISNYAKNDIILFDRYSLSIISPIIFNEEKKKKEKLVYGDYYKNFL